jgi:hypothetical protein
MTNPIDAKRALLEDVLVDQKTWASKKPGHYGVEALLHLGLTEEALDFFARTGSPIHIETAVGHLAMALAWRAASGKTPLKQGIPQARAWLKGELEEAAKHAMAAAAEPLEDRRPGRESA